MRIQFKRTNRGNPILESVPHGQNISVVSFTMYVSFLLSLGMSRSETPSPAHSSKKDQKKCVLCHSFMSELDPHPECNRCLPRLCCKGSPCPPHCLLLSQDTWKKWEHQESVKKSSSTMKEPKGELCLGGGGGKAGKVSPAVPSTPKPDSPSRLRIAALEAGFSSFKTEIASMFASLTGRFTVSHPPDSNTDGSRLDRRYLRYLRFCHNGTTWQFTVLPFGLSTSPRVFTKILKQVLAYAHLHRVNLHMHLDDWLLNPGTHQEALEQTSWLKSLCRKLGLVLNLEKSDIIPSQVAGDRAGHSCGPGKAITQESDQLAIHSGGIHDTAVTTCYPVALSTWTSSLSRETRALWSNSHSSHSMAIETPLEPVKGKSSKLIPPNLQSRLAILWWPNRDNLRRGVPIGTIDVEYYLYTDSSSQGWGAHLQENTASGIWSQDQSQLHINVLELQAIWLGLKAYSQRVENAKVALMSDNTSAVAYLRNQGAPNRSQ